MSGGNCALIGGPMPCSSYGRSRGRGPASGPYQLGWFVYDPGDVIMWVKPSRAEAARVVRDGNAAIPRDRITRSYRWRYEARRIPLDGSSEYGAALRTGACVGCVDGRLPSSIPEHGDTD